MDAPEPDYVTIQGCVTDAARYLVQVMHYGKDEWVMIQCSHPVTKPHADALAATWAAARKVQVRL